MKTLDNTYCIPNIEEWEKNISLLKSIEKYWWRKYDDGNCFLHDNTVYLSNGTIGDWNTRTEIPVQQFIDLIEDKICKWRLEEVGFMSAPCSGKTCYAFFVKESKVWVMEYEKVSIQNGNGQHVPFEGIKTFTDIQKLIHLMVGNDNTTKQ